MLGFPQIYRLHTVSEWFQLQHFCNDSYVLKQTVVDPGLWDSEFIDPSLPLNSEFKYYTASSFNTVVKYVHNTNLYV